MTGVQMVFHKMRDVLRRTVIFSPDNRLALFIGREHVMRNLHVNTVRWPDIARQMWVQFNTRLTTMSTLFARQCHAIAAQRVRRTLQIAALYGNLGYDRRIIQAVVERIGGAFIKRLPKYQVMLGLTMFAWHKDGITDEEMTRVADEILHISRDGKGEMAIDDASLNVWEPVISKNHLMAWRKPVPNSYLYEYKVYGTYNDIPSRAFFRAQVDLEFRKQWDKLVIDLDVVDEDEESGAEVIHWVTHFPYPMYSRDYVYVRKFKVDNDQRLMVIVNRSVDHPAVPVMKQYVRVNTYMSQMVIRPHTSFDENGFDYILTYYDDPKSAFPSVAYNWMATTGVPDFVNKVHAAAKMLHDRKKGSLTSDEETEAGQRIPM